MRLRDFETLLTENCTVEFLGKETCRLSTVNCKLSLSPHPGHGGPLQGTQGVRGREAGPGPHRVEEGEGVPGQAGAVPGDRLGREGGLEQDPACDRHSQGGGPLSKVLTTAQLKLHTAHCTLHICITIETAHLKLYTPNCSPLSANLTHIAHTAHCTVGSF